MAIKKPARQKKEGKNTALVVFLVFFILLSIGLGVWGYYGYAGQDKLRTDAKGDRDAAAAAKEALRYYRFLAQDTRLALTRPKPGEAILTPEEATQYGVDREDFLGGKLAADAAKDKYKELIEQNSKELGYIDAEKKYAATYQSQLAAKDNELRKANGLAAKLQAEIKDSSDRYGILQTKQEGYWKKVLADIRKGNADAIAAFEKQTEAMTRTLTDNQKLKNDMAALNEQIEIERRKLGNQNRELQAKLKALQDELTASPVASAVSKVLEPHALLLDVSRGKPLWERPLGKIVRVEPDGKTVAINMGSRQGVQPDLALMVFGQGWDGRAGGPLKATLEVVRVVGPDSSVCRVTSLYDLDGHEMAVNDPSRGRIQRASDNALREGDLLYHPFFGSHVAIAGTLLWNDYRSQGAAEQARALDNFMLLLRRQGIVVDAYVDPADGAIKGALTKKTRYLIRGLNLTEEDGTTPAAEGEMPKGGSRAQRVNAGIAQLRADAVENGIFIVSLDNFLNVIGYRPPRSAEDLATSGFRPGLPTASSLSGPGASDFLAKMGEVALADFAGEWQGLDFRLTLDQMGKGVADVKLNLGMGVSESSVTKVEVVLKDGRHLINVGTVNPYTFKLTLGIVGTTILLEEESGRLKTPRLILRKKTAEE